MAASFEPAWLRVEDVKAWLRIDSQDVTDDDLLTDVCAAVEPYVERCRPEFIVPPIEPGPGPTYSPDAEAYRGAVMYAAREYRRRNSPAGLEMFGETTSFVSRYDTDIERFLHTGAYAPPIIA